MSLSSLIIDDGNTAVLEPEGQVWQTPGRLRDKFGRAITDLRVSVTDRCNYKCVYCRTGHMWGRHPLARWGGVGRWTLH